MSNITQQKTKQAAIVLAAVATLGAAAFWLLRPSEPPLPPLPPVTIAAPPQISAPVLVASAQGLIDKAGVAHTAPLVENQTTTKNVLLLYSYGHGSKGIAILDDSLLQSLSAGGFSMTQLFFEYLDLERNIADPQYRSNLRDLLDRKYRGRKIDLIVTVQQPALNYLLNEGRSLAEGAPAITVQAPMPSEAEVGKRRIVSMLASFDINGTLERALELFPDTRRVVFVAGASEADRNMSRQAASITQPWQGRLEFEYTTELSLDAMLTRVASLPPRTIVIFTQYNRDASGKVTVAYEVEAAIIKAANAPVFGLYDFNLVNGGIGGSVISVKDLGQRTGTLALDLLHGRQQLTQPVSSVGINTIPMFDWEQIKRWSGNVSGLHSNTVFVNRVPTFWEQYGLYVIGVGGFVVVQAFLIAALLISGRKRRLMERSLQESEENLSITLHSIGDAVIATDPEGRVTRMNQTAERLSGWTLADAHGRPLAEVFHIISAKTRLPSVNPVQLVMESGKVVGLANHTALLARDGKEYQVADSAAPIRDATNAIVGVVLVFSDVTEKYRAEDALRDSEQRFRAILEAAPVPMAVNDLAENITYLNAAFTATFGYALADIPTLADWWPKAYPDPAYRKQVAERWQAELGRSAQTRTAFAPMELTIRCKDGTERVVLTSAAPLADVFAGTHLVVLHDITDRKHADEALRASEIFGRAILDSVSAEIAVLNHEGVIVAVNAPWQRFANENGFAPGQAAPRTGVGSNYLAVCATGDGAEADTTALDARQGIQAVLSGSLPSFTLEYPCHSPDEKRWFSLSATPLGAKGQGVVVSHTNITVRRLAEIALRVAKDHLETTLNAIPDLLFEVDGSGRVLSYHARRSDLLAAPPEVFMGKSFADFLPPAAIEVCMNALRDAATKGWATGATYSLPLPQGETWFELSAAAMPIVAGATPRFILLTRDVTERIQAHQALQAALREKTALLLEVHHRVKNNLQIINSLLRLESFRSTDAPTKSVLQDMQGRVRSMALLHETIYRRGTFAAIDLGSYIGQIAGESLKSMNVNSGAVRLQLDVETLQVGLDQATPAGMLVSELVSNCFKHAFPEGHTGEIGISLHPLDTPGQWRLQVSDSGIGFPADFEERRKTSLGLQLAGDMATQMGGALHIGAGPQAVFTVDFKADVPAAIAVTLGGVKP